MTVSHYNHPGVDRIWNFENILSQIGIFLKIPHSTHSIYFRIAIEYSSYNIVPLAGARS